MRSVSVTRWDKVEIWRRASAQNCFMADVVKGLLDAAVEQPEGLQKRRSKVRQARLQVYVDDAVRLKVLKQRWGVYVPQVISYLLRAECKERRGRPSADVWAKMVQNAEGYRRQIAEYEAGASRSDGS